MRCVYDPFNHYYSNQSEVSIRPWQEHRSVFLLVSIWNYITQSPGIKRKCLALKAIWWMSLWKNDSNLFIWFEVIYFVRYNRMAFDLVRKECFLNYPLLLQVCVSSKVLHENPPRGLAAPKCNSYYLIDHFRVVFASVSKQFFLRNYSRKNVFPPNRCILMQMKLIFVWKVLQGDSFWNRGTNKLGNWHSLLHTCTLRGKQAT